MLAASSHGADEQDIAAMKVIENSIREGGPGGCIKELSALDDDQVRGGVDTPGQRAGRHQDLHKPVASTYTMARLFTYHLIGKLSGLAKLMCMRSPYNRISQGVTRFLNAVIFTE